MCSSLFLSQILPFRVGASAGGGDALLGQRHPTCSFDDEAYLGTHRRTDKSHRRDSVSVDTAVER
jgi:hypothetical protein